MEDTIASIQRDEAHSPFMLERLYNQVCSKCVHYVRDLSYRVALSTTSVGSALDAAYAALATALALLTTAFALRTADLAEPRCPRRTTTLTDLCFCCAHRTLADQPHLPTRRPSYASPLHCPHRRLAVASANAQRAELPTESGLGPMCTAFGPCTGEMAMRRHGAKPPPALIPLREQDDRRRATSSPSRYFPALPRARPDLELTYFCMLSGIVSGEGRWSCKGDLDATEFGRRAAAWAAVNEQVS